MYSRDLQPCSRRDISHLINWLAGRKPTEAHTKGNRVKGVLALNAGEMARGNAQCNSAKFLPESPWLRGLCFGANLIQTGSWGLLSSFQSAQRKFQQSGSGGVRSCLLPGRAGDLSAPQLLRSLSRETTGSVVRLPAACFKRAAFKLNLEKESSGNCICSLNLWNPNFSFLKMISPGPGASTSSKKYCRASPVRNFTYLFVTFVCTAEWLLSFIWKGNWLLSLFVIALLTRRRKSCLISTLWELLELIPSELWRAESQITSLFCSRGLPKGNDSLQGTYFPLAERLH